MKTVLAAVSLAVAAAVGVAGCASTDERDTSRTAGEFTGDAAITAKVKTAIATDVGARAAANIDVNTYRGVVQLTGFVDNQEVAQRAADVAQKVGGVKSVKNDTRVKSSS